MHVHNAMHAKCKSVQLTNLWGTVGVPPIPWLDRAHGGCSPLLQLTLLLCLPPRCSMFSLSLPNFLGCTALLDPEIQPLRPVTQPLMQPGSLDHVVQHQAVDLLKFVMKQLQGLAQMQLELVLMDNDNQSPLPPSTLWQPELKLHRPPSPAEQLFDGINIFARHICFVH
eukprot:TRINITY_DN27181_c0_g1_i3.p1 TRINITY_DN27181_c0_g1~~TRINITY_DN27181_c0_g1_i3.p1  ORF type:complete len:169 (+),score=7.81 TRINITY_DN27181_c0_g1_i3:471-977(+)